LCQVCAVVLFGAHPLQWRRDRFADRRQSAEVKCFRTSSIGRTLRHIDGLLRCRLCQPTASASTAVPRSSSVAPSEGAATAQTRIVPCLVFDEQRQRQRKGGASAPVRLSHVTSVDRMVAALEHAVRAARADLTERSNRSADMLLEQMSAVIDDSVLVVDREHMKRPQPSAKRSSPTHR